MKRQHVQITGFNTAGLSTKLVLWTKKKFYNADLVWAVTTQSTGNVYVGPKDTVLSLFLALNAAGNCADPAKNNCDTNANCIDVHSGSHLCVCSKYYSN